MIKILHISAAGPTTGAGKAVLRLHSALSGAGESSRILFLKNPPDGTFGIFSFSDTISRKTLRLLSTTLDRVPAWLYIWREKQIFSPGLFGVSLLSHPAFKWADIIHLHWVNHGFIKVSELKKIGKPVVWTMHDMWPFTGGCHQSFSCERFTADCGKCPMLGSSCEYDLSHLALLHKRKNIPVDSIVWVTISSWMSGRASVSSLLRNASVSVIPSGIDAKVFSPNDQVLVRKNFGLPLNKKIILLGADNLQSPYKGLEFSLKALRKMGGSLLVVTFGNSGISPEKLPQNVINLGYIDSPVKLAELYSASDVFLATSVAESFGMTVAEAQCCGLPVVAFDSLGPKDILAHEKSGYLAQMGAVEDLIKGLTYCLSANLDRDWISHRAAQLFSIDNSANAYLDCYRRCLSSTLKV